MKKCKVIGLWNIKGGVGKTTTTLNVAIGLKNKGKKVVVLDLDPQANLTSSLLGSLRKETDYKCLTDLFVPNRSMKVKEAIYSSDYGVDVIGSNLALTNAEILVRSNLMANQHMIFKNIIDEIKNEYDYIIMDCPPSLNLVTTNMALCVDMVITPIAIDEWSFDGYELTSTQLKTINDNFNKEIKQKILFTKTTRTKVDKETIEQVQANTNLAFETRIRNQEANLKKGGKYKMVVESSQKTRKGKLLEDVGSDYRKFVEELIKYCESEAL